MQKQKYYIKWNKNKHSLERNTSSTLLSNFTLSIAFRNSFTLASAFEIRDYLEKRKKKRRSKHFQLNTYINVE